MTKDAKKAFKLEQKHKIRTTGYGKHNQRLRQVIYLRQKRVQFFLDLMLIHASPEIIFCLGRKEINCWTISTTPASSWTVSVGCAWSSKKRCPRACWKYRSSSSSSRSARARCSPSMPVCLLSTTPCTRNGSAFPRKRDQPSNRPRV